MAKHAAVAGGGIIGASIAWKLARAGLRVTIFDAGELGGEASHAGAGMLAPGGEVTHRTGWGDLSLASACLYPQFVAELDAESGEAIDYRRSGGVELALNPEEWDELRDRALRQEQFGIVSRPLPPAELRAMVPTLGAADVQGAQYYVDDGVVDPRDVMRALRRALVRMGVTIRERCAVTGIQREGPVTVRCGGEQVPADAAVLAAGAWSGSVTVAGASIPRSFPVRGHMVGYRLAPGLLGPILRHQNTYLVQRRSGFLLAGVTTERTGFDREIDPKAVADIRGRVERLVPGLLKEHEPEAWLGFRPATDALAPEIGEIPGTRIWLSYGHYRNGILMAPETARRVSTQIVSSLERG